MMQKIHLDISEKTLPQIVYAKQFDVGRKFIVALYDSGTPYTIPESATLSVGYAAADGKNAGNFSGAVASENTIEITIDEIMTSTAGNGVLSVTLLHENGNEISTWNIPYSIEMQPGSFPIAPSPNTVNLTKAVLFSAQNLTDAQKAQARKNIGVTGSGGGGSGEDGFSPIATVMQTSDGAIISITDKSGTTAATVTNGKDGADGKDGQDGYTPQKGVDYFDGQPGKDGVDGYTPVKGKDYFDGVDGQDGKDGVSPTVAVSKSGKVTTVSITDKNGTKTATINDGADGSPGSAGKDGTSVTHSWSGTTLTVTSASGTSSANLKGEKGDKGDTGATGATGPKPVKGVDYWTDADQESIVQQVIAALGTPVFGRVDEDNNIILTGELADGTYVLKYEDGDGNVTVIGMISKEPPVELGWVYGQPGRDSNTQIVFYSDLSGQTNYKMIYQTTGNVPLYTSADLSTATNYYPLVVPEGKTKMKLTFPNLGSNNLIMSVRAMTLDGNAYKQSASSGWLTEGVYEWSFDSGTKYLAPYFRNNEYGGTNAYDTSGVTVSWE